jgi:hypothetical protein
MLMGSRGIEIAAPPLKAEAAYAVTPGTTLLVLGAAALYRRTP